jgi:hypothetical protein
MEPNQTHSRPSRSATRPNYDDGATTQSAVKKEEVYDDEGDAYRSRRQLQRPLVLMRNLAEVLQLMDAGVIDVDPEY